MDKLKAYDTLGLPQNASEDDIKAAYRDLAQKYSSDNYEAGPLREEAGHKMDELNDAFDTLMSYLRTGADAPKKAASTNDDYQSAGPGKYPAIRQLINSGRVDEAITELSAVPHGSTEAEWNFLMGSAYYYKGWLDQAIQYFREAVRIDPGNREYEAALRNLQNARSGNMQGNPYQNQNPDAQAMNCACNTCTMMCCMDACCSMCRGF